MARGLRLDRAVDWFLSRPQFAAAALASSSTNIGDEVLVRFWIRI